MAIRCGAVLSVLFHHRLLRQSPARDRESQILGAVRHSLSHSVHGSDGAGSNEVGLERRRGRRHSSRGLS